LCKKDWWVARAKEMARYSALYFAAVVAVLTVGLAKDAPKKGRPSAKAYCSKKVQAPQPGAHAMDRNGWRMPTTCYHDRPDHHVFVIGDWGGRQAGYGAAPFPADRTVFPSHARHFVGGVDNRAQQRVAQAMQTRAIWAHPEYILNVGDNFYWGGVNSRCGSPMDKVDYRADCDDVYNYCAQPGDQWKTIFLDVYGYLATGLQWLGVLGNHDYGGFMFTKGWDQAIARSYEPSANGMWVTPAQYWSVTMDYENFTVDYYFMDTNHNDAHHPNMDAGHNICSAIHNPPGASCGFSGPSSVWDCPGWFARLWQNQKDWIEGELQKSSTDWQIIVTHFPPDWETSYWQYLTHKYGIDMMLTGHRHMQELHQYEAENALRPTPWIVTGGGGGVTSEHEPTAEGTDDQYGFVDLTLWKNEILVQLITHTGRTLKETKVFKRLASKWREWDGKGVGPYHEGCLAEVECGARCSAPGGACEIVGNKSQAGTGQAWNCEAAGGGKHCENLPECKECCCLQNHVHEELAVARRLNYAVAEANTENDGVLV